MASGTVPVADSFSLAPTRLVCQAPRRMESTESFKVWACDNMVYGPIDLDTLKSWVQDERVLPSTWIHVQSADDWCPAKRIAALEPHFAHSQAPEGSSEPPSAAHDARPDELRSFPLFSSLSNDQLEQFLRFCQVVRCSDQEVFIRRGDPADGVYFVLEGTVRARLMIGMDDKTLAEIPSGESFGEMAMFTQSARSADIVGQGQARLLRLSAEAFHLMTRELPAIACPILVGMAKALSSRIAEDNVRLRRDVASSFLWRLRDHGSGRHWF